MSKDHKHKKPVIQNGPRRVRKIKVPGRRGKVCTAHWKVAFNSERGALNAAFEGKKPYLDWCGHWHVGHPNEKYKNET